MRKLVIASLDGIPRSSEWQKIIHKTIVSACYNKLYFLALYLYIINHHPRRSRTVPSAAEKIKKINHHVKTFFPPMFRCR